MIRSRKVLNHAKGKSCSAMFPGVCNGNPETTVFCHLNGFGKGAALKTHDTIGFEGCAACHAYYDVGHGTKPLMTDLELLKMVLNAVCVTHIRLVEDGIVFVPLDKPKAPKPIKRKPKGKRTPVRQGNSFKRPPSNTIDINADRTEATE